ncbi:hypothetical protein [Rothia nasimurium]|uniref:hypothetical protein n=1 Tax=Rothia nasimurium TaxID=85336 RepID=UPI001F3B3AAE|nr:hypothetical protein [Rothia nasimurium]
MSSSSGTDSTTHLVSSLLRSELLEPYVRDVWERYVHHEKLGEANPFSIRAIARAMSAHQHTVYGLEIPPHKYKDRVRRAITGEHISSETIDLLSETFGFDERTRKTLHKAATQGFDDSETVQFLRTNPQVLTSSCYLDIQLDPTDPGVFTLHATYTLLSLESGCSAFVFSLPQGQELICDNRHFSVSRVSEDQEWVFTPTSFIQPLQTFMLRFNVRGTVQPQADGSYQLLLPFTHRSYSAAIKLTTAGKPLAVRFTEQTDANASNATITCVGEVTDYLSHFYPSIKDTRLTLSWSAAT